jgi:hypothetical protein
VGWTSPKRKAAGVVADGRGKASDYASIGLRFHAGREFALFAIAFITVFAIPLHARAETCFSACFRPKLVGADIEDTRIRSIMRSCRDTCEEDAERRLSLSGRGEKLLKCLPEPINDADFKRVRAASPSFVAFANTFTWDIHNVLPDRVIKRVEAITQNLALEDVVLGGGVTIAPGETETVFIPGFFDGYPQMRVSTRVKAIYACPLD